MIYLVSGVLFMLMLLVLIFKQKKNAKSKSIVNGSDDTYKLTGIKDIRDDLVFKENEIFAFISLVSINTSILNRKELDKFITQQVRAFSFEEKVFYIKTIQRPVSLKPYVEYLYKQYQEEEDEILRRIKKERYEEEKIKIYSTNNSNIDPFIMITEEFTNKKDRDKKIIKIKKRAGDFARRINKETPIVAEVLDNIALFKMFNLVAYPTKAIADKSNFNNQGIASYVIEK